jgi:hypothetical protein
MGFWEDLQCKFAGKHDMKIVESHDVTVKDGSNFRDTKDGKVVKKLCSRCGFIQWKFVDFHREVSLVTDYCETKEWEDEKEEAK